MHVNVAGYKLTTQKSSAFLHTNEINKVTIPLAIRYIGINLTKEARGLCNENFKALKDTRN